MKKKIRWDVILLGVAVICFCIFGVTVYNNNRLEQNAHAVRTKIEEIIQTETAEKSNELKQTQTTPYDALFEQNEDMVAWLLIPDTNIDYPVMQTPEDEEYYLYRDFFGNEDKNGTLFLDSDCSLSDERSNLIIHGHNMKSGAMFGNLSDYMDAEYGKQHCKIYLYTRDETRVYEVMSVFNSKVYRTGTNKFLYYNYFQFDTQERFNEYYKGIKKMSMYDTGVTAVFGDEFITLSTCAYHTKDGRFAVVAKRVE